MKPKVVNIYKFHMCLTLLPPGIEPVTFALCPTTLPTWLSNPPTNVTGLDAHKASQPVSLTMAASGDCKMPLTNPFTPNSVTNLYRTLTVLLQINSLMNETCLQHSFMIVFFLICRDHNYLYCSHNATFYVPLLFCPHLKLRS